ncbi:E7 [Equus caballus papillomavirus 9]|uniref:Protein E7 n=1 Tax=Equus caballus papillomavirus 9 TaxID=2601244 RepID=A0A5B8KC43_9PAPI|nr:E7 [Equus caballus papillomavirus 9]UXP87512.1 E7 protein [Equus caballus papillomavirus 9]UXP87519.1 E7 protein [Equus caballus papillomavirus 9]
MRGQESTIPDVCLQSLAELNLQDSESAVEFEEEIETEVVTTDPYRVACPCCICGRAIRLVVSTTATSIRELNKLLSSDLGIICPACATTRGYNGR